MHCMHALTRWQGSHDTIAEHRTGTINRVSTVALMMSSCWRTCGIWSRVPQKSFRSPAWKQTVRGGGIHQHRYFRDISDPYRHVTPGGLRGEINKKWLDESATVAVLLQQSTRRQSNPSLQDPTLSKIKVLYWCWWFHEVATGSLYYEEFVF